MSFGRSATGRFSAVLMALTLMIVGFARAERPKRIEFVPGEFVVELRRDVSSYDRASLEKKLSGKILRQIRPNMIVLSRVSRESAARVAQALRAAPEVRLAEPNMIFQVIGAPNDPDYLKQWGLSNLGIADADGTRGVSGIDIGLEKAREIEKGSKDVVVAVIDTGVDYTHPDLKKNMWVNTVEATGTVGVDDDGNGYVDDVHGINAITDMGDPLDDNGHGTHCAGTIGAESDNALGIVGVSMDVSIMAIKFLDASGYGSLEDAVQALDYAAKSSARILSNSWGGSGESEILKEAVGRTNDAGKLFIAAAGNNTTDIDKDDTAIPAAYTFENMLAVAAITNRGDLAYFSNYGATRVHVAAPGMNVYSTSNKGGYDTMSGTSMAAPHVSGIAALVLSANPAYNFKDIKTRIIGSARPLRSLTGKVASGGLADAYYALSGLTPPPDPNDPSRWTERAPYVFSTEHPYKENTNLEFKIVMPGAKRFAIHFPTFETEAGYDRLQLVTENGDSLGYMSGKQSGSYSPIIDGDNVTVKFASDSVSNGYGFDIDFVVVDR